MFACLNYTASVETNIAMLIHGLYIISLALLILSLSPLFTPLFELIHLPAGMKTVFIQLFSLVVTTVIFITKERHKRCFSEVLSVVFVWLPFIAYMAIRTDFSDEYSSVKFWKIIFISFLSAVSITIIYMSKDGSFNKYFFPAVVALVAWQLVEALVNPAVFMYASTIERMTVDSVNPIWLARAFATAALCCLMLPIKSSVLKITGAVVFLAMIIPTGSRGPLLAGGIGFFLYFSIRFSNIQHIKLKMFFATVSLLLVALASSSYLAPEVGGYFTRGSEKSFVEESGRLGLFSRAWGEYMSSPAVGVGFGQYGRSGQKLLGSMSQSGYYPHNIILEILSELGMLGIILFAVILRPGEYLYRIRNIYQIIFIVYLLFSMTSGSLVANSGLMVFATLARLSYKYPDRSLDIK